MYNSLAKIRTFFHLLQHSMIYFFHHYELPAILQQIRIQEMLLQNQQVGQGNQTALQDNLNNNTSNAAPAGQAANANGQDRRPAQDQPQVETHNGLVNPGPSIDPSSSVSDLDWMAEIAIGSDVLSVSHLSGSLLEPGGIQQPAASGAAATEQQTSSTARENQEGNICQASPPAIDMAGKSCAQGLGPPGGGGEQMELKTDTDTSSVTSHRDCKAADSCQSAADESPTDPHSSPA